MEILEDFKQNRQVVSDDDLIHSDYYQLSNYRQTRLFGNFCGTGYLADYYFKTGWIGLR